MSELAKAQSQVDTIGRRNGMGNFLRPQVNRSDSEDGSDVAFRLGLVRQACAQFMALWREYATSMQTKLGKFHQVRGRLWGG